MTNCRGRANRQVITLILMIIVAGLAFGQYDWSDIVRQSEPILMESWGGVGYGEVAAGFVSFAIDVAQAGPLTIEVAVTDVRQGSEYSDDDSMLWLFSDDAFLVAENDDGPYEGYASLINGAEIPEPGRYYAIVTTHPNRPELGFEGEFAGLYNEGRSSIAFELIVEYGSRDEGAYYGDPFESAETAVFFEEFADIAEPVTYSGEPVAFFGSVGDGVALYRMSVTDFFDISAEVYEAYGDYGDTKLFIIDELGFLVGEDDDSGRQGGSLIPQTSVSPAATYYIAVTTFPNGPNIDEFGFVEGFPANGGGFLDYELVIDGPRDYYDDYDYSLEYGQTEIWFDEFPELAIPLYYDGFATSVVGEVEQGVTLYRLEVGQSADISLMVNATGGGFTDTVLFLIDPEGYVIAEDDDGAGNGGSLIPEVFVESSRFYYVAVVSYPNWPNTDSQGYLEGFPLSGEGYIEYQLTVDQPRDYNYPGDGFGGTGEFGDPAPDGGFPAYGIEEVAEYASFIPLVGDSGVGYGEVGTGFAAFAISVDESLYLSMEVVVTEVRQGTSYADSDSVLSLFGSDGLWYATDDDGGVDGASKLVSVWIQEPGTYYAIVTTYPNEPASQFGFFDYVEPVGESNIAFELRVSTDFAAQ